MPTSEAALLSSVSEARTGRSGGFRTLRAFKHGAQRFFVRFRQKRSDKVDAGELKVLRKAAR